MPEEREIEIVGVGVGWVGVGVVGGGGCGGLGLVVVLGVRWGEVGGIKPPLPPQTPPVESRCRSDDETPIGFNAAVNIGTLLLRVTCRREYFPASSK